MSDDAQLVDDCEKRESRLSDWERGFVDDLGRTLERGRALTDRQREKLEQIWERVTEDG